MSSNPKKRSFIDHSKMPKRENQGFVVVKKKKTLPAETSLHSKNSLEKNYQLLQENVVRTQTELKVINEQQEAQKKKYQLLQEENQKSQAKLNQISQQLISLEENLRNLHQRNQSLLKNNIKLESLNQACASKLFQDCQNEEQLVQLRDLLQTSSDNNYEQQLKQIMISSKIKSSKQEQEEVIKALKVLEKY